MSSNALTPALRRYRGPCGSRGLTSCGNSPCARHHHRHPSTARAAATAGPLEICVDLRSGLALLIFTINGERFPSPEAALWLLNWVHVFFGLSWTGIDLFMGFLLGPILRRLDPRLRRTVNQELSARFFWIFPMLSTVTPTAGWELAGRLGYLDVPYPGFYWVEVAVALVIVMAFFGVCFLAPVNLWVLWELRKPEPNMALVQKLMRIYLAVTALEAMLPLTTIMIMTRFRLGI